MSEFIAIVIIVTAVFFSFKCQNDSHTPDNLKYMDTQVDICTKQCAPRQMDKLTFWSGCTCKTEEVKK